MNLNLPEKRVKSIAVLLVIVVCFFLFYQWVKKTSAAPDSINKIVIKGHQKLSTREIITILGIQPGVSFEHFNLQTLEKNLKLHPRIRDASISQQFDNRLFVNVTEKEAAYIVKTDNHLYEVDREVSILSTDDVREPDLCVLSGDFNHTKEKFTSSRVSDLTGFVSRMFEYYPALKDRIAEINLAADGEIYIYTYRPVKLKILMGTTIDMTQVRKLYAALSYFEAVNKSATLLDLRGEDAVYH